MNAFMNIQVRVLSTRAQAQIRALEAEVAKLRAEAARTGAAMNTMGTRGIPGITKWGNQIQWAGRQLQYNFTLPIVLAGAAATKFALDNERALVRVIKVYGDGSEAMNQLAKTEIPALEKAFVALSNRFGIAQADAINIAADWAAAGASGVALARSVKATMETMILGEMGAKEATEALIAIQAQYQLSTKELSQTIDILNMVENQTGISMAGLVQGMARSAGVARTMGVDVQHLAAMMAALVPATGGAAAAGNGLKTILSRLMSPTNEAAQVMGLMGINTSDLAWQSLNATQRLEKMAAMFVKLDDAQKIVVTSTVASRWQINRFGQLMSDINNPLGYYHRSLQSTADASKNFAQRQKELDTVLESSPQRLKQMWVMLQNSLAKGIQPMIPAILILTNAIAKAAQWFSELDPAVQKLGLAALFTLAAIGPLVRYMGSVAVLLGVLQEGFTAVTRGMFKFGGTLLAWVGAPFKYVGTEAGKAIGAIKKAGPGIVAALRGWIVSFAEFFGGMLLAIRTKFLGIFMPMIRQFSGLMVASFTLMGRNIAAAWAGTWRAVGALWAAGATRLMALQMVFSRNFTIMWAALSSNILALWRAMTIGLVANFRRAVLMIPLLVRSLPSLLIPALTALGSAIVAVFTSPWFIAAAAVLGVLYAFKDKIVAIFKAIPEYLATHFTHVGQLLSRLGDLFWAAVEGINKIFWKLPEGVRNAMLTVLNIIKTVALKVYEWFSYLNPFAKHSPSLVEQVTKGMAIIRSQYASVGNVGGIFAKAASDLAKYKRAMDSLNGGQWADERAGVASSFASALPLFDALVSDLNQLNRILAVQAAAVSRQQAVVDGWEKKLEAANAALDAEQNKLDRLKDQLDALTDAYASHRDAMEAYASAPLKGMGQMEDAIFANEMAQKRLRLEMLKWEDANGSIEDMQNSMAKLAGEIEKMQGEVNGLIAAGAGSDITGPMQQQIAAMQQAYSEMDQTVQNSPVSDMQKELERLARQGEMLDLEKSLKFDELQREIAKLVDTSKELTFDEIVAGIKKEQDAMAALQPQIDAATKAVQDQQAAVDAAKASRDAIQATYDTEKAKLDALKDSYDKTADAVRNIESALSDMGNAASAAGQKAQQANKYLSPGAQNFLDAAGGNFPDVSGSGLQIGREGGLEDQSKLIDQFTKDTVAEMEKTLGKIDMFGPIKEKWNQFTTWLETNVWSKFKGIGEDLKGVWSDLTNAIGGGPVGEGVAGAWDKITGALATVWDWGKKIWSLFKDDLKKIWDEIIAAGGKIWDEIGPELAQFKDLIPGLSKIFGFLFTAVKNVTLIVGGVLLGALKIAAHIFANVLGPAIDFVVGIIKNVIRIMRGLLEFLVGLFTGDIDKMVQGVKDMLGGLVEGIWSIIKNGAKIIWGAVSGLVEGIVDFFVWLWDELVGHSIIPDMINSIIEWFKSLPGKVWEAVKTLVDKVVKVAQDAWDGFSKAASSKWSAIITWIKSLPGNVWDNIKDLIEKLRTVAGNAWDAFKSKASERWSAIVAWVRSLPDSTWEAIKTIVTKLGDAGYNAMKALWDKAKSLWDGSKGILQWFKDLPGKIADAMGSIGAKVANAVKSAWNGAAKWINDNGIGNINKVTSKLGFTLSSLPTFQRGGVIPGKVSATDNTIIAARTGEGVIVPELVRHLGGSRGLNAANKAAASGNVNALRNMGLEGFADGGVVGKISGWLRKGTGWALSNIIKSFRDPVREVIPARPYIEDWTVGNLTEWANKALEWGNNNDKGSGGIGGRILDPSGYQNMIKAVKNQFPNAVITSSFRPGAITALGNTSMHSIGRAIDIAPDKAIFNWIRGTYGAHTKQLFYSPEDGRTLLNGRNWNMDAVTKAGHWDHVHWGYDKGGILPPGSTLARNATGKNEYTLTAEQWQTFSNVVALLDAMTLKSGIGATPGAAAVARVGATLAVVESRLRSANTLASTSVRGGTSDSSTYNFYGDLEFPNIKTGDDAEDFLRNLKGLGG